jgi:hypothetical protein
MNMRTKSACLRVLVLPLLLGVALDAHAQENCCIRDVWTAPFALPPAADQGWSWAFSQDMVSALQSKLPHIDCPPIDLSWTGNTIGHAYKSVGEVTTEGLTQIDHDGHLRGTFVARVRLIDPDHGDAVLREARPVSWTGLLTDGLNHQVSNYEPSTGSRNASWMDLTGELGKQFMDINTLIYDYERKPQKCQVNLTGETKDVVDAGKTVTVTVSDIIDHEGRPPQPWQRIVIHPDKGKLLNCTRRSQNPDDCVFEAGSGTFEFTYQAPDNCKISTDTLTVYNSCEKRSRSHPLGDTAPEDTIGTKTLNITCDRWDVTVTYTEQVGWNRNTDQGLTQMSRNYSITLKGRVHFKERRGSELWYESDSASIDLNDLFSRLDVLKSKNPGKPDLKTNVTWGATRSGQVPMKMRVRFSPKFHNYSVQWVPWKEDPIVYKGTYQWSGWQAPQVAPPEGAFEFTCREIVNALPEWPPGQQPFAEGQTVLKGQESWRDPSSSVVVHGSPFVDMSQECTFPAKAFTPNSLTLSGVIDPLSNPYAKTRSWEVRRPQ